MSCTRRTRRCTGPRRQVGLSRLIAPRAAAAGELDVRQEEGAPLINMRDLRQRTPVSCPQCGGAEFDCYETGCLSGSRGPGLNWLVRCRGCGGLWKALALIDAVLAGTPLEWFGVEHDSRTVPRVEAHRSNASRCAECQAGLTFGQQSECSHCGWLRYPTAARERWGRVGSCPQCGFAYRWDGAQCSHCGHPMQAEPVAAPDPAA